MDAAKPMVRAKAWVGVDVGKEFHWAVVVDAQGEILLSRRVENEEADLSALVEEVLAVSGGEKTLVGGPGNDGVQASIGSSNLLGGPGDD